MKDKRHRITLRLSDEQYSFVKQSADTLDVSPSELLRMVIVTSMVSAEAAKEKEPELQVFLREALERENDETYIDS